MRDIQKIMTLRKITPMGLREAQDRVQEGINEEELLDISLHYIDTLLNELAEKNHEIRQLKLSLMGKDL